MSEPKLVDIDGKLDRLGDKLDAHIADDKRDREELREELLDAFEKGQAANEARHNAAMANNQANVDRLFKVIEGRQQNEAEDQRDRRALRKQIITGLLALLGTIVTGLVGYWMGQPAAATVQAQPTVTATEALPPAPE